MDKSLSFCEMLREAQTTKKPFYFSKDNNETCVVRSFWVWMKWYLLQKPVK